MKRSISAFIVLLLLLVFPVSAADGKVTYDGDARQFIFEDGSEYSPTDLFPNFKGVMPGDTLTQKITVRNDVSNDVKVKIYLRSLGAKEGSEAFLSQLGLTVKAADENEMAYMFDAAADETAQLTERVCLGTLYSGGEVDLDVTLSVPVELDNAFQDQIGHLDWEFSVEEFPVESDDPRPPQTGESTPYGVWIALFIISAIVIVIVLVRKKKTPVD